jgi:N-methylhydantoinase A
MMYAFGGAGPIHCAAYGKDLHVKGILVPLGSTSATFSAFGLAAADVTLSAEMSDPTPLPVSPEIIEKNFAALEHDMRNRLGQQGLSYRATRLVREIDVRYTMQMFEVSTPVPPGPIDQDVVEGVMTAFEDRYAALYGRGTGFREAGLQAITYRVYGLGELPFKPVLPTIAHAKTPHPPIQNRRRALLDVRTGWQDVAIYNYAVLAAGHEFDGPAIVEAPTTTVVVPQGAKATVDLLGNLVMNYS